MVGYNRFGKITIRVCLYAMWIGKYIFEGSIHTGTILVIPLPPTPAIFPLHQNAFSELISEVTYCNSIITL